MKTTVVGPYPKISEDPTAPNLRSALNRRDAGKISDEELESVYRQTIARVIREQEEAGLDEISDGLIRWDDLCDPFARHWSGMSRGGLLRFFDNNTYYRQPIISGPVNHTPATVEDMVVARNYAHKPIKAVLPGPFTLAALSIDRYYGSQEKLVMALAEALHQEALALATAGAASLQLDEPSLALHPDALPLARQAVHAVVQGLSIPTTLFIYFGNIADMLPELVRFPVTTLGIDCVSRPENLEAVLRTHFDEKGLVLGIVDARNTKMERMEDLLTILKRVTMHVSPQQVWISPSAGLEFLPHRKAQEKLRLLVQSAQLFRNAL